MSQKNHYFLGWDYKTSISKTFNTANLIQHDLIDRVGYFHVDGDIRGFSYGQILQAAETMSRIPHPEGHGNVFKDALENKGQPYEPDRSYFKQFYINATPQEQSTLRLYEPPVEETEQQHVLAPAA